MASEYFDAIFDFEWQRKAGERKKFVPRGRSTVKNKERGRGRGAQITFFRSPPHRPLNCKSNMAGRINDCEFIALACINKTPALQAHIISNLLPLHFYSVRKVSKAEIYTKGNRTCLKTTFLLHSINLK